MGSCSYCAIRRAIGPLRSKPPDEILAEVGAALDRGNRSVNLLASDSGAYGLDIGTDLPALLSQVLERDGQVEVAYLQDLNPLWLVRQGKELVSVFATPGLSISPSSILRRRRCSQPPWRPSHCRSEGRSMCCTCPGQSPTAVLPSPWRAFWGYLVWSKPSAVTST